MPRTTHRDDTRSLTDCQKLLGHRFRDLTLLREALTHASGANHRLVSNERLEFLGDAILGAIVCDMLFRRFPDYLEGDLTRIKSIVVSRRTCAKISKEMGIDKFLIAGKGIGTHDQTPSSMMADVLESVIGAVYLDGGMEAARNLVVRLLAPEIDAAADGQAGLNFKSDLQQVAQREFGVTPSYHVLDEKGPDHSKCFKISARIGSRSYAPAWGPNKKEAEQRAALNALCQLTGESLPFDAD
jgi:ribonuclease-3